MPEVRASRLCLLRIPWIENTLYSVAYCEDLLVLPIHDIHAKQNVFAMLTASI